MAAQGTSASAPAGIGVRLRDGRLPPAQDHSLGLFLNDCRYLRTHELSINGALPRVLVASDALGPGAVHELTNPKIVLDDDDDDDDDDGVLPLQSLQIRIERRVTARAPSRSASTCAPTTARSCGSNSSSS